MKPNRHTLILAATFLILGGVLGTTITWATGIRHWDPSAYAALGTWAATFTTITAVLVAWVTLQADVRERRHDRNAAERRRYLNLTDQEDREQADHRAHQTIEQNDASLVTAEARVGSTSGGNEQTKQMDGLSIIVSNDATVPATNIAVRHNLIPGQDHEIKRIDPSKLEHTRSSVNPASEIPADRATATHHLTSGLTLTFTMHRRQWTWTPSGGTNPAGD